MLVHPSNPPNTALAAVPASGSGPTSDEPDPSAIIALGTAFWGSKTLLSAVELGVFSELTGGALPLEELRRRLDLHERGARDFFDALVALGMLHREGGHYANTAATEHFLDRAKPSYIGGILEMANARLYPFWGALTDALHTGEPQNEAKRDESFYAVLYSDEERLRQFLRAMTGISLRPARGIAERFPFEQYRTFAEVGCAEGALPVQVALMHPHITGVGFDLAPVGPIFDDYVASFDLTDRLAFQAGDFFAQPLPAADVLTMGHILHNWDLEAKLTLLEKAYAALPEGGALIVYEAFIDDERRLHAYGLLMSLNMLIETAGGFDFTTAECQEWMRSVGFRETRVEPLVGPDSMVVAVK
ncbi:MAG: methyltransferase [Egibacteraceae bacterium]